MLPVWGLEPLDPVEGRELPVSGACDDAVEGSREYPGLAFAEWFEYTDGAEGAILGSGVTLEAGKTSGVNKSDVPDGRRLCCVSI